MQCHICSSSQITPYKKKNEWQVYRCGACSLLFVDPIPDDLSVYYTEGYFTGDMTLDGYMDYDEDKAATRDSYERLLDMLEQVCGGSLAGRTLFEVGCATGFFLELAAARGATVSGIDISSYAVTEAQQKGLDAVVGTVEDIPDARQYDIVVMLDVIEHVRHPRADIQATHRLLRTAGIVVFITPDTGSLYARLLGKRWHAFVPPQHLFYFNKKNITTLLTQEGFTPLVTTVYQKRFSLPYIFRALYSWQRLFVWRWLAQWCAAIPVLKELHVSIPLRDNMLVIAKKEERQRE